MEEELWLGRRPARQREHAWWGNARRLGNISRWGNTRSYPVRRATSGRRFSRSCAG